jgi:hypothetical protein
MILFAPWVGIEPTTNGLTESYPAHHYTQRHVRGTHKPLIPRCKSAWSIASKYVVKCG